MDSLSNRRAQTPHSLPMRLFRAGAREVANLYPASSMAQAVAGALPPLSFNRLRTAILRIGALSIGARSLVMGPLYVYGEEDWRNHFSIGTETFVTGPLHVNLGASVRIGDRVSVGADVFLLTVDHAIGDSSRRAGRLITAPIVIEDGAWLGARVTVLPGVTIGAGAVIAAGAVVSRDVPPNSLVGGVPARVLRFLEPSSSAQASPQPLT
jgi:maltose O-acetyltransferase